MATPDDKGEALALAARTGDRGAFTELVLHFRDRAYRVSYRVVGNREDALDVTQDAFIRLHAKIHTWNGQSRFFSWFYRLLRNLAIDHIRKRSKVLPMAEGAAAQVPDRSESKQERFEAAEEHDLLMKRTRRAVAGLPEAQRAILALRHYEGLPLAEIARMQGVALGTVKSTLFAAVRKLRKELGVDLANETKTTR